MRRKWRGKKIIRSVSEFCLDYRDGAGDGGIRWI